VLGGDGLIQLFEAGVLRGEAALAGRVDDEDDLAVVFGEGVVGAGFWSGVGWLVSGVRYSAGEEEDAEAGRRTVFDGEVEKVLLVG
jgi:hypothetical protein